MRIFGKTCPAVAIFHWYFLDREARVRSTTEIEALSLGEAISQARERIKTRRECLSFEIWQSARRVHPERRDDSIEQAAKRLETLLGSLAREVREPRPHKLRGRPRN